MLSRVRFFATLWTIARQAPLSLGFSRQVDCHALLQGIFSIQGIKPRSPALQADSLPTEPPGKAFTEAKCVRSFCMDLGICTFYLVLVALSLLNHFWNYKMTDCLVEPGSLHNPYLNFFLDYSGILFFWITLEEFTKLKNTHTQNQFNWILS